MRLWAARRSSWYRPCEPPGPATTALSASPPRNWSTSFVLASNACRAAASRCNAANFAISIASHFNFASCSLASTAANRLLAARALPLAPAPVPAPPAPAWAERGATAWRHVNHARHTRLFDTFRDTRSSTTTACAWDVVRRNACCATTCRCTACSLPISMSDTFTCASCSFVSSAAMRLCAARRSSWYRPWEPRPASPRPTCFSTSCVAAPSATGCTSEPSPAQPRTAFAVASSCCRERISRCSAMSFCAPSRMSWSWLACTRASSWRARVRAFELPPALLLRTRTSSVRRPASSAFAPASWEASVATSAELSTAGVA